MEKPKTAIMAKVPISDRGMAITGMITERNDPRKAKTTSVTITSASSRVWITSSIELLTNSVES